MARFTGAVSIVTTDGPAGQRGVTVSAATSVSDNPPTLLVCLNRNREENRQFAKNGGFVLNALCHDQIALARAFAGEGHLSMPARFALGEWQRAATGAPLLKGSRMSLDCRVTETVEMATHIILFGEVVDCTLDRDASALVYLDRAYRSL